MRSRLTIALAAAVTALVLSSCGPRMDQQPSIRAFSRQMPEMPAGTVPTAGSPRSITARQSQLARNPVPSTKRNLRNGEIYYGYYCLMCHGEKGDGQGPVGVAYVPEAADLTTPEVAAMPDGQLYRKMLKGPGHDPVMEKTVLPDQRWPLVMYIRTLSR